MEFLVIFILFIIAMSLLLYYLYKINVSVKRWNKNIDLAIEGNYNVRFFVMPYTPRRMVKLAIKLNKLLQAIQKMAERQSYLESTRKQMIANMSHDLRTPLTSILGYLEAIKNDPNLTGAEKEEFIEIIRMKAEKLNHQIYDFFELAKIESEDISLKMEKVNLKEKAEETILMFYQDFVDAGIEVEVDLPGEPVYIKGDQLSIDRILYNLISNALKYGKDGKKVGLHVVKENDQVVLEIWDSGQGIPANDFSKLFERLYTSERSRSQKSFKGSGLGLTITKKLVQMHGGTIEVSSIPMERTTFSVHFPLIDKDI
ncbi:sensor histidine kinase [Gracilibacillus saliphilus]|uniref:sensor histidine kinase n=1 Tax=Gracilibacillus saliphilus TaxID=543890 RepID=UPI0013D3825A|nr:HAMP domain-containing sensor histidine kinase [Gracilibacillus saliphilus]